MKLLLSILTSLVLLLTGLVGTAEAAPRSCPRYEALLAAHRMPVRSFSRIMFRESRCNPSAVNRRSSTTGLLQIHPVHRRWIAQHYGIPMSSVMQWLKNPANNVAVAAILYHQNGMRPWRL